MSKNSKGDHQEMPKSFLPKSFLIDTTLCTACRACQVACKQWHDLPAEKTTNKGSYQNPEDLSFSTYKLVRMTEKILEDRLHWLFFPDQCRHCLDPDCLKAAENEKAIYKDEVTGAVIYTKYTKDLYIDDVLYSCPYNIPRPAPDGTIAKCDMCNDRVHNNLAPACVATCPTGCMNFGDRIDMVALAKEKLKKLLLKYPDAMLLDASETSTMYLVAYDPTLYGDYILANADKSGVTARPIKQVA